MPSQKQHARKHYEKNKTAILAKNEVKRAEKRKIILDHLLAHPCVDCGEADPLVLDFDHRDPEDKSFSVGNGVSNGIVEATLRLEISKCDVRCANCHRRRTAKQFNWHKYRALN
jgi:hypothetical protein